MKEKIFATMLRTNMAKKGQWCRIENAVGVGIPDVNFFYKGKDHWIEIKIAKGRRVVFEASQITWFTKRNTEGGEALVFIRKDNTMWIMKVSDVVKRVLYSVKPFLEISHVEQYCIFTTKKPFDWEGVLDTLKAY